MTRIKCDSLFLNVGCTDYDDVPVASSVAVTPACMDDHVPAASSVAVTPGHTGDVTTTISKTYSEFTSAEIIPLSSSSLITDSLWCTGGMITGIHCIRVLFQNFSPVMQSWSQILPVFSVPVQPLPLFQQTMQLQQQAVRKTMMINCNPNVLLTISRQW